MSNDDMSIDEVARRAGTTTAEAAKILGKIISLPAKAIKVVPKEAAAKAVLLVALNKKK